MADKSENKGAMDDKENEPPTKKRRLSLSLKNRFNKVSDSEVAAAKKGFVPKSTRQCNNWALKNFQSMAGLTYRRRS